MATDAEQIHPAAGPLAGPLADQLREAIRADGRSVNAIAVAAGISCYPLRRFISGDGDLRLSTAARIAEVLGLRAGPAGGPDASLAEQLRQAIRADGRPVNAIALAAGVPSGTAYLFLSGGMGLMLANAGKLAAAVGLAFRRAEPIARGGPDASLAEQLRQAIRADGRSANAIALAAGVLPRVVRRFDTRERDLTLATADRIAEVLGLRAGPDGDHASVGRQLRRAIRADGRTTNAIAWAAGFDSGTVHGFASGERDLTLATASRLATLFAVTWETRVGPAEKRPNPGGRWDDWDASICPVHVREDGHLVVFGRVKRRLVGEKIIALVRGLVERYPGGGFGQRGLTDQFGRGARQSFYRLKNHDPDCDAAFQPAGVHKTSLYRIGKPD